VVVSRRIVSDLKKGRKWDFGRGIADKDRKTESDLPGAIVTTR
jgi:hypothetical protein